MKRYLHNNSNSLLDDICHCSNIADCVREGNSNNPCYNITTAQEVKNINDFQVPEPWNGSIVTAPVLFVGDYASMRYDEEYPNYGWPSHLLENYFNHRFSGGLKPWIKDGLYPLYKNGQHSSVWNRFWSSCKNRALELYRKVDVVPGFDFSTTMAVRCRVKYANYIKEALDECVKRHLAKVICLAGAAIIVGLGKIAVASLRRVFYIQGEDNIYGPIMINNKLRYFAFLPHYNTKGPRTFGETFSIAEMNQLICFLEDK